MKLKNLFNSQRKNEVVQEFKADFNPILEKVTVPVTLYAKRNPTKTFFLMITIVIANILILFFFTDAFKAKDKSGLNSIKFQDFKYKKSNAPKIEASFGNIRKVKAMKDTLEYLMSLKKMTYVDTLTFIRVMDDLQKMSSRSAGLRPLSLEQLRRAGNHLITDSTINKNEN